VPLCSLEVTGRKRLCTPDCRGRVRTIAGTGVAGPSAVTTAVDRSPKHSAADRYCSNPCRQTSLGASRRSDVCSVNSLRAIYAPSTGLVCPPRPWSRPRARGIGADREYPSTIMITDPAALAANPFAALTAIAGPAILTNAC
jgi:hypothetical protein